mmetsp:Transcript_18663/g.37883  ORF Transcript_18663/g.37883 Transcript_18663/m.37883 type:complete len:205 (+) Transcript_18663:230-844(+)
MDFDSASSSCDQRDRDRAPRQQQHERGSAIRPAPCRPRICALPCTPHGSSWGELLSVRTSSQQRDTGCEGLDVLRLDRVGGHEVPCVDVEIVLSPLQCLQLCTPLLLIQAAVLEVRPRRLGVRLDGRHAHGRLNRGALLLLELSFRWFSMHLHVYIRQQRRRQPCELDKGPLRVLPVLVVLDLLGGRWCVHVLAAAQSLLRPPF